MLICSCLYVKDDKLRLVVAQSATLCWKEISETMQMPEQETIARYLRLTSLQSNKHLPWSCEEDEQLFNLVEEYGAKNWTFIASKLRRRHGKQCRERWQF